MILPLPSKEKKGRSTRPLAEVQIGIIGATGAVGREVLAELSDRRLCQNILPRLFASPKSAGERIDFNGHSLPVEAYSLEGVSNTGPFNAGPINAIIMSAGGAFSRENARAISDRVDLIVDNSSAWRMNDQVALIVPEVNSRDIDHFPSNIIANPNCSTIQLVRALKVFEKNWGLEEVVVSTYQSLSGSGQKGIDRLNRQRKEWAQGQTLNYPLYELNFDSLIPAIDTLSPDGHCFEEVKMVKETQKILSRADLSIRATTIRVPVERCHAESVDVGLKKRTTREEVLEALAQEAGLQLFSSLDYNDLPFGQQFVGKNTVGIGRVRTPVGESSSRRVMFWNIADNLRVGAASNAVSILEDYYRS